MPGTLHPTQDAQAAVEQHVHKDGGHEDAAANEDPTTLKFEGKVAISDEDAGSDPYNRTGKFRRVVR
jgi:hypothetical protein